MEFEGLSPEVLQGQLLKATLVLRNEGAATAGEVFIKLSQPLFVFYLSQVIDRDGSAKCTSPSGSSNSSGSDARGLISLYGKCFFVIVCADGAFGECTPMEIHTLLNRIFPTLTHYIFFSSIS